MTEQSTTSNAFRPPGTNRKWIPAAIATALMLALLTAGVVVWLRGRQVWTDDQTLRIQDRQAHLRQVLWSEGSPIEGDLNSADQEYEPAAPNEGAELFFVRGLPGKGADLYVSTRREGKWSSPAPLKEVNTPHDELGPRLTPDGRFLLFYSDRPGGLGQYDLWACPRENGRWGRPFNLGPNVNSPYNDYSPAPSPDGKRLYFATNRKAAAKQEGVAWRATIREAALGDYDLFVCDMHAPPTAKGQKAEPSTQPSAALSMSPALELVGVNTPWHDGACSVSPGGDFLYFASNRPGGQGGFDLYRCRLHEGVCERVENLGPQINTPHNDTDPQPVMGGFTLYFSSDREQSQGGYDLFQSHSREVYALREPRPLPQLGWSWYALLIALALLIPLLLWLRAVGYRHLSLLQKCLAISLLIHLLLTVLFSTVILTQRLVEYVAREAGMTVAVNLDLSRQVEVSLQVRKQLTDLPVNQAAPDEIRQVELPAPPKVQPQLAPLNVPAAQVQPASFTIQPEAPKLQTPRPAEAVSLPQPELLAQAPQIQIQLQRPVRQDEPPPPPAPTAVRELAAKPVEAPPAPDRPVLRPAPIVPVASVEPQPTFEPVLLAPRSALQPRPQDAQQPRPVELMAAAVAPASPVQPTTQPVRAAEARPDAQPAPPQPIEIAQAPAQPLPTSGPGPKTKPSPQALPAAQVVPHSAVTLADVRRQAPAPPRETQLALDVPSLSESIRIQLPVAAAPAQPAQNVPPPVVAAGVAAPRPLEAKAVSLTPAERPSQTAQPAPDMPASDMPRTSMIRDPLGSIPRAASIDVPVETPMEVAFVTPITAPIGPGRLASPESLFQRSFEQRQKLIREMGGSKESEEAVGRALGYLARRQQKDGSWPGGRGEGKGSRGRPHMALTGMATLSFLASDHTHTKPGPYREAVSKAVEYLLSKAKDNGDLRDGGDMYCQAIATLAVAEAAIMTGDDRCRQMALKAADFIVRAQNRQTGGWRYDPGDPGDTSVVGWQVMALHSVEMLGYRIPQEVRDRAFRWLDHASAPPLRVLAGYQGPQVTPSMTAEAVFTRILLGQRFSPQQEQAIADYLLSNPPAQRAKHYYYWYYATLALSQMRGEAWEKWNNQIQEFLRRTQQRGGEEDGCWDTNSKYGSRGGKVYTTAINALTLEVYYRYLPMYKAK